jgi:hypothetical protein
VRLKKGPCIFGLNSVTFWISQQFIDRCAERRPVSGSVIVTELEPINISRQFSLN